MFTDLVGFSALSQRNEKLSLDLLQEHNAILRSIFPEHDGREIKTTGDGFLVRFESAVAAVECASRIQRQMHERNVRTTSDRQICLRIGIHLGDVIHRDGDVFGDGVNIAARLCPLAEPNGVWVSVDVERQVRNKIEVALEKVGSVALKNIPEPLDVSRLVFPWEETPNHALKQDIQRRMAKGLIESAKKLVPSFKYAIAATAFLVLAVFVSKLLLKQGFDYRGAVGMVVLTVAFLFFHWLSRLNAEKASAVAGFCI